MNDCCHKACRIKHELQPPSHQHAVWWQWAREMEFSQPLYSEPTQHGLLLALLGVGEQVEVVRALPPAKVRPKLRNSPRESVTSTPKYVIGSQPRK